jgi:hypothetical protein
MRFIYSDLQLLGVLSMNFGDFHTNTLALLQRKNMFTHKPPQSQRRYAVLELLLLCRHLP